MAEASASYNPFDNLTAELGDLSLGQRKPESSPHSASESEDEGPRPPDPIRVTGYPAEVVAKCPGGTAINYSLTWYYLPEAFDDTVDFVICTRCHADHIRGTALEIQFKKVELPDGQVAVCGFRLPRIKDVLWPEALRTNNVKAVREYMTRRLQFKPCPGQTVTEDVEGRVLYGLMENEIEGFLACEACFEDYIVGTGFESHFGTYPEGARRWSCDMALPYILGAVAPMSKYNNWNGFITTAGRRMQLPACKGEEIQSDAVEWYLLKNYDVENFQVCETCYLDKIAVTPFKTEFQRLSGYLEPQTWRCSLADKNLSTVLALGTAQERRDFEVFVEAAQVICSLVPCTATGILYGRWFTIEGCEKFNICEACHAGFVRPLGLDDFFPLSHRDASTAYVCDFSPGSPRFMQYMGKFSEMLDRGVFTYFSDFVKTFAGVPACPKIKGYGKARWWGYPEAPFCEECYLDFVAHTRLGDSLPMNGVYVEHTTFCHIWSPRLRELWGEVCEAGEPGSEDSNTALGQFKDFCKQRLEVYHATIGQIEVIKTMQKIKRDTAFSHAMLSIQYQGMDARAHIFGGSDGRQYGNSSIGWFDTSYGVTSRQFFNSFQNGLSDANRPEDWMRMAQLEALWKKVE